MISVILPTMWRGKEIQSMLPLVDGHDTVGEIILINNDIANTPTWFTKQEWNCVKEIRPKTNLFVNPSWNGGIKHSKFDQICLLSDDVLFDIDLLDFVIPHITTETGPIGYDPTNKPKSIECATEMIKGWGVIMFFHKRNFHEIPHELKIYYGDRWIFEIHKIQNKQPRSATGFNKYTALSTTHKHSMFDDIREHEISKGWSIVQNHLNRLCRMEKSK